MSKSVWAAASRRVSHGPSFVLPLGGRKAALWVLGVAVLVCSGTAWAEELDAAPDAAPDASAPAAAAPSSPLQAMAGHVVLERDGDVLRVTEVFALVAEAPVPARPGELWMSLPEGARDVEVSRGEEFARVAAQPGLELHGDIEAGRGQLALAFEVDAPEGRAMLAHELPFAVQSLHVVWPAGSALSARAMGFEDTGVVSVMGRQMRVLERSRPISPGGRLAVLTAGQAEPPRSPEGHRHGEPRTRDPLASLVPVTLVLAALILVAGLLLPSTRRLPGRRTTGSDRS